MGDKNVKIKKEIKFKLFICFFTFGLILGIFLITNVSANWCYQETANISTSCGGLSSGNYSVTNSGNNGYLYINYTKPIGALNTSLWQVKGVSGNAFGTNFTIDNNCFSQSILQFQIYITSDSSNSNLYSYCYNGSSWVQLYNTGPVSTSSRSSSSPINMYDEHWNTNALFYSGSWYSSTSGGGMYEEAMNWDIPINITSPINNQQVLNNLSTVLNFTSTNPYNSTLFYSWNNGIKNYTICNNCTSNATLITFPRQGFYNLSVYANKSDGSLTYQNVNNLFVGGNVPSLLVNSTQTLCGIYNNYSVVVITNNSTVNICSYNGIGNNGTLQFNNLTYFIINFGSSINGTGSGGGGYGIGFGGPDYATGGGGGYGGNGGNGNGNFFGTGGTSYGASTNVTLMGSNGGTGLLSGAGGIGGGYLFINSTYLLLNGNFSLSGTGGTSNNNRGSGGGSGGGIWILTNKLNGNGIINTKGGSGSDGNGAFNGGGGGGGGAGGRIFVQYLTNNSIINSSSNYGIGGHDSSDGYAQNGSIGSVLFQQNSSLNLNPINTPSSITNTLQNNTNSSSSSQLFTYNISDDNDFLNNISIFLDGISNQTISNIAITPNINNSLNFTINNITSGTHNWYIQAYDSDNAQSNSSIFTINIITTPPNATLISPFNNSFNNSNQNFTINASDNNVGLSNVTLNIYNSTGLVNQTNIIITGTQGFVGVVVNLVDGVYTWFYNVVNILGTTFTTGNYTFTKDATNPQINITNPLNNSNVTNNHISINYTVSDTNIGICWWNLNGGSNGTLTSCQNITGQTWIEGNNIINIFVNDSAGNVNSSQINFNVDSIPPSINIIYPTNSNYSSMNQLNYTYSDAHSGSCWYSFNGTTNSSIVNSGTNFTGVSSIEGINNLTLYCNDSFGNNNQTNVTFLKDSIAPNIQIITPSNNTNSSNNNLNINYTYSDVHTVFCKYSNDTYSTNTTLNNCNNITNLNWSDGLHNLTIWADDNFGNENSSQVTFRIDTTPPVLTWLYPIDDGLISQSNTNNFNYSVSDSGVGLSSCWWSNSSGLVNHTISCGTNITDVESGDGYYNITLWSNDTLNNVDSIIRYFHINANDPIITLLNPIDNIWFNNKTINFNFSVNHVNPIGECELWTNTTGIWALNQTNTTSVSIGVPYNFSPTNIPDGYYIWNVRCNETGAGRIGWYGINRTFFVDSINPNLILYSPINQSYNTNILKINYSVNDTNLASCWFNINNTQNITLRNCNNASFTTNQGSSLFNFFVNDSAGNLNKTNVSFFVDSINPSIILNTSFSNGSYLNYSNVNFNISASDTNLASCWYNYNNNGINQTFSCGNNISVNLPDGFYTFNFYDNDILNNSNQTSISFTVDTAYPIVSNIITSTNPANQVFYFSFSAIDINLDSCKYNIDNGINISIPNCMSVNNAIIPSFDSLHNLTVYARDLAGNENYSNITLSISSTTPNSGGGGGGQNINSTQVLKYPTIGLIRPVNITAIYSDLQLSEIFSAINNYCEKQVDGALPVVDYYQQCNLDMSDLQNISDELTSSKIVINVNDLLLWYDKYKNNNIFQTFNTKDDINKYNLIMASLPNPLVISPITLDKYFIAQPILEYTFTANKPISLCQVTSPDKSIYCIVDTNTTATIYYNLTDMNFLYKIVYSGQIAITSAGVPAEQDTRYVDIVAIRVINTNYKAWWTMELPIWISGIIYIIAIIIIIVLMVKLLRRRR